MMNLNKLKAYKMKDLFFMPNKAHMEALVMLRDSAWTSEELAGLLGFKPNRVKKNSNYKGNLYRVINPMIREGLVKRLKEKTGIRPQSESVKVTIRFLPTIQGKASKYISGQGQIAGKSKYRYTISQKGNRLLKILAKT